MNGHAGHVSMMVTMMMTGPVAAYENGFHGDHQTMMMLIERLRRGGRDPLLADTRPLAEVLDDYIPYKRWARELTVLKLQGYKSWQHYLKSMKRQKRF